MELLETIATHIWAPWTLQVASICGGAFVLHLHKKLPRRHQTLRHKSGGKHVLHVASAQTSAHPLHLVAIFSAQTELRALSAEPLLDPCQKHGPIGHCDLELKLGPQKFITCEPNYAKRHSTSREHINYYSARVPLQPL